MDTYKITLSNGTTTTFTVTNGVISGDTKNIYQIYKENNPSYTGDENQWIDDLINGKLAIVQTEKFVVTFDSNGGSPVDSQQVVAGQKAIQPDDPTRDGHFFEGWYAGRNNDEKWVFSGYAVTENITLVAKWRNLSEEFVYLVEDDKVTITAYVASDADIVIPSTIEGKPVVAIGARTFESVEIIKSVYIPASVTTIGEGAFLECEMLTTVTFAPVSNLESIETGVFAYCRRLKDISLPDSVAVIGEGAFRYCENLRNIDIPDSVAVIGEGAFYNCENLKNIDIPASVTAIDTNAFLGCKNLKKVTFANNSQLSYIGEGAFQHCSGLTSVIIPAGVTNVSGSFDDCGNLAIYCESTTPQDDWIDVWTYGAYEVYWYSQNQPT